MICDYCNEKSPQSRLTGQKRLKDGSFKPYEICSSCCKELQQLSVYRPSDVKKRNDFWQALTSKLETKHSGSVSAT